MSSSFFETYLILLNCVQCLSDICVVRLAAHVSFIGKTACGVLLNKKMPARRRAQRQDASWIRRYKSLPLQNRHQVRHHLDLFILKNIRETTLVTVKEAVEQSTVFKKKVTKVFINSKNTMAVLDINKFKRHGSSAFHGILISASRTKATVTTKGNKLKFSTMRTGIHGTVERSITTVYYFIDIFHLSISGMEGIFYFLIIIGKDSL